MKRSNRSKSPSESLPIYLVAVVAIMFGGALIWLSWQIEEAHEAQTHFGSPTDRGASANGEQDNAPAGGANPAPATTSQTMLPNSAPNASQILGLTNPRWKIVSKGLGELGLALISVGFIAVLLEVRVMSEYFEGKIARSMIGREYLKKLTKDQLEELQADSLRACWGLEEKDRKDLLDFCKEQVHGFIAEPYRENVRGSFKVTLRKDNKDLHEVQEQISWTSRRVKGKIQDEVRWTTRIGEILGLQEFKIILEIPLDIWKQPEFRLQHPHIRRITVFDKNDTTDGDLKEIISSLKKLFAAFWDSRQSAPKPVGQKTASENAQTGTSLESETKHRFEALLHSLFHRTELQQLPAEDEPDCYGYKLSLVNYVDVDHLRVTVHTKYAAPASRSLTWQMSHPSRNVVGFVSFEAEERTFFLESFGLPDKSLHHEDKRPESPHQFEYDSWLLPECGFVFHFLPKNHSVQASERIWI